MDPSIPDFDTFTRFANGEAAMAVQSPIFYTLQPEVPFSMAALADREGKTVEEVAGVVPLPGGTLDEPSDTTLSLGATCFSPDLNGDELSAAVDLYHYLAFGEGDDIIRQTLWEETEDARYVFDAVDPAGYRRRYRTGGTGHARGRLGAGVFRRDQRHRRDPARPVRNPLLPAAGAGWS